MKNFIAKLFGLKKNTRDFSPENRLEFLLIEASQNPGQRLEFYKKLLESDIFILGNTNQETEEGLLTIKKGQQIKIAQIMVEGEYMIPIFSSLTRLKMFITNEESYLRINFKSLFQMKNDDTDVILNPNASYGKIFTSQEIRGILTGDIFNSKEISFKGGEEVLLGQPAQYPVKLVESLKKYFATHMSVKKAYLAQIHIPSFDQPPHPVIGIEVDGDFNEIVQDLGSITIGSLADNQFVDYVPIDSGTISDYLINKTEPFYVRL